MCTGVQVPINYYCSLTDLTVLFNILKINGFTMYLFYIRSIPIIIISVVFN